MKNFLKNFNQFQRLDEQAENRGGIPPEMVSYIEELVMFHPNVEPGSAAVGVNPDGKLYVECRLQNERDPILMEYTIQIGNDPGPTFYIFIETFGSSKYEQGLEYYLSSNIEEIGLSENGVIEAVKLALDNGTKDWSEEGPQAEGPIEVELKSDPGKKLIFKAYFD